MQHIAQPGPERATHRTVILLRESEKAQLERLASQENISSGELIRRFIRSGEAMLKQQTEEQTIEAALKLISTAAREANASMTATMDRLDALHLELEKRALR